MKRKTTVFPRQDLNITPSKKCRKKPSVYNYYNIFYSVVYYLIKNRVGNLTGTHYPLIKILDYVLTGKVCFDQRKYPDKLLFL